MTATGLRPGAADLRTPSSPRSARGTPMGELLRRYWHPVGLAADAGDTPRAGARARRGPDPVPRRTGPRRAWSIRAAAIAARRSTTARSRSAASAAAITAGCSTSTATASSSRASPRAASCATACASPGIRCEERYGLVFAYLGPPEKKPVLPRYECLEELDARRVPRGRRHQHRQRRPADRAVQLAAALRERASTPTTCRSCTASSAAPQFVRADGADAQGEVERRPSAA